MKFTHIPVESTNLKSIAYNEENKVLEVLFNNGTKYQYKDVPLFAWQEFQLADSKGSHFNKHIKPIYKSKKVNY